MDSVHDPAAGCVLARGWTAVAAGERRRRNRVARRESGAARAGSATRGAASYLEQMDPYFKSGALARPVAVGLEWRRQARHHLGQLRGLHPVFRERRARASAAFEDRGYLKAGGKVIRKMAGPNGSVQGPAEAKWGYTNLWVADWDLDGKLDDPGERYLGRGGLVSQSSAPAEAHAGRGAAHRSGMAGSSAETGMGLVGAEGQATGDAMADHAAGGRLGWRRVLPTW